MVSPVAVKVLTALALAVIKASPLVLATAWLVATIWAPRGASALRLAVVWDIPALRPLAVTNFSEVAALVAFDEATPLSASICLAAAWLALRLSGALARLTCLTTWAVKALALLGAAAR